MEYVHESVEEDLTHGVVALLVLDILVIVGQSAGGRLQGRQLLQIQTWRSRRQGDLAELTRYTSLQYCKATEEVENHRIQVASPQDSQQAAAMSRNHD